MSLLKHFLTHWFMPLAKVVAWFAIGYVYFWQRFGWDIGDAIYLGVATVTTVGFGDLSIINNDAKLDNKDPKNVHYYDFLFSIAYLLTGIVVVFPVLSQGALVAFDRIVDVVTRPCDDTPDDDERPAGPQYAIAAVLMLGCWIGGAAFMHVNEGWEFIDALYWAFVTMTTIGYGDKSFTKQSSILFATIYILCSTILVIAVLSMLVRVRAQARKALQMQEMLDQPLDKEFIDELDRDGDGQIDKGEFLEAMLIRLGKVTKEDTYPIMKKFSQLDQDGSGFLDEGDIPSEGPESRALEVAKSPIDKAVA